MLFGAMKIESSCSRHIELLYQQLTVMGRCWDDSQCLLTVRYHVGIFLVLHQVGCRFQFLCFAVAVLPPRIGRFLLLVMTKEKLSIRRMRSLPFYAEWNVSSHIQAFFYCLNLSHLCSLVLIVGVAYVLCIAVQLVRGGCCRAVAVHLSKYHKAQQH